MMAISNRVGLPSPNDNLMCGLSWLGSVFNTSAEVTVYDPAIVGFANNIFLSLISEAVLLFKTLASTI